MNILCALGFHKPKIQVYDPKNSTATCQCGGWRMFHDIGVIQRAEGNREHVSGDCGNFQLSEAGWVSCEKCHHFLGDLTWGWNSLGQRK